jgi:hypothetical protein
MTLNREHRVYPVWSGRCSDAVFVLSIGPGCGAAGQGIRRMQGVY